MNTPARRRGHSIQEGPVVLASADVMRNVFSYLRPSDLSRAACTCKRWRALVDENVWNAGFAKAWGLREVMGNPRDPKFYDQATVTTFVKVHRVQKSDSLAKLALRFGHSVNSLKVLNSLVSDWSLYSREHIYVPARTREDVRGASVRIEHCSTTLREYCIIESAEGEDEGGNSDADGDKGARDAAGGGKQTELMLELMQRSLKIDEGSARFYLDNAEGDLKTAMANYKSDFEWERSQSSLRKPTAKASGFCCY